MILLFLGMLFIILSFFRPKEDFFVEEKMEKIFEDFMEQINMENEQILDKMKHAQEDFSKEIESKIKQLEERMNNLEKNQVMHSPQINQKYKQVLELYQNGDSIDLIAKKTKIGHGEIQLILELFKKGFNYV